MTIESFVVGPLDNNVYLVVDDATGKAAIIDPGIESESILESIGEQQWELVYVINTHGHFDHIYADAYYQAETGAALLIHEADVPALSAQIRQAEWFGVMAPTIPTPDQLLSDGDQIAIGETVFTVLHTPGHSPGGICLYSGGVLFSGDTLFAGSVGRTDMPGGDYEALMRSIRNKLLPLPDATAVYPGHGSGTTIGVERARNPFLLGA